MELEVNKQCFNLFDTNGRRADILNAYSIYLNILDELSKEYPTEVWTKYPKSILQFEFYKRAIEASPDVFKTHHAYDTLYPIISQNIRLFYERDNDYCEEIGLFPYNSNKNPIYKDFDVNIEKRARDYTSNLVKMGFASTQRKITEAGYEYLSKKTEKDSLEKLLPLSDFNIILLRQVMKLKIFSESNEEGKRKWYSPLFYSIKLLIEDEKITKANFKTAVLSTNPYNKDENVSVEIPSEIKNEEKISEECFKKYYKSRKSNENQTDYYKFYSLFYDFFYERNHNNYKNLIDCYMEKKDAINKWLFSSESKLNFGTKAKRYTLDVFLDKNKDSLWLNQIYGFNNIFYEQFTITRSLDLVNEYGDTLFRILTATGIFNFSNALPELRYKQAINELLSGKDLDSLVFGEMTNEDYLKYEIYEESYFGKSLSFINILDYNDSQVKEIIKSLQRKYGSDVISKLENEKKRLLEEHVHLKYPKDKIIELLGYFKGNRNDKKIKKYVESQATVPTMYEYITTIAWYYISNQNFSIYDSLNLSLDGNLEPLEHAQGGAGDIVINYDDKVIMLEVTLMNKAAQKRGEWEPVLRHSVNLKVENEDKEVTTLFIADELDFNTINIWRAIASVPLESTNGQIKTKNVYIMPFTNDDIISYLSKGISSEKIISHIQKSYKSINTNFDDSWREKIIENICS